jgi:hypothetical protein
VKIISRATFKPMDNIISNYGVWHSRENKSTLRAKFFEISIFALPAACKSLNRATRPKPGLPDGFFSNPNHQFG